MGMNDKSFRLQYLRDRLHIKGEHTPTFCQAIAIIVEVLGTIHSGRNLTWCKRETAKLRARFPEMTPDQLERIAILDDKLARKAELIRARKEKKRLAKADPKKRGPKPTPESKPTPTALPDGSVFDPFAI